MDNANIHKSLKFIKNDFNKKFPIIYNVPYSPELNAIESVFCKVKI